MYLVGGAVRDALLGQSHQKDFDMVICGVNAHDLEKTLSGLGTVDLVGKTFGVFKFMPKGTRSKEAVDIALPRTEHARGTGGYREVEVQSDPTLPIEKDLERRDFTINALAVELGQDHTLRSGKLIDPFHGLDDLRDRLLRCVGEPSKRFQEDFSRMLRALRFSCQLHCTIEPATWDALVSLMPHINDARDPNAPDEESNRIVPYEVIAKELLKSFWNDPIRAFDLYAESGATKALMPELLTMEGCPHPHEYHSEGNVWAHTRLALSKLASPEFLNEFPDDPITMETIIGVLFHDVGKPPALMDPIDPTTDRYRYHGHDKMGGKIAGDICSRLKLSSASKDSPVHIDCDNIVWIVEKHLLLLNSKIQEMRASTIERYFFNPRVPGITLLQVILADSLATVPLSGQPILTHFNEMKTRIEELLSDAGQIRSYRSRALAPALLSGNDVMKDFHLSAGPKIGKLLKIVREEQLQHAISTREQALLRIRQELRKEPAKHPKQLHQNQHLNV